MSEQLKTLQENRQKLAAQLKAYHGEHEKTWSAENEVAWGKLNADYDASKAALDTEVAVVKEADANRAKLEARLKEIETFEDYTPTRRNPRIGRDGADLSDKNDAKGPYVAQTLGLQLWANRGRAPKWMNEAQQTAARSYIAANSEDHGEIRLQLGDTQRWQASQAPFRIGSRSRGAGANLDPAQFTNDMVTGTLQTGGSLIGETMLGRLEAAMLAYMGVLQVAEILTTDNGETMRWPTMDDTGNVGTRVGENQDATAGLTSTDPNTGRLSLQAFVFTSGGINLSRSFMQDNGVNFESLIGKMLGVRIGRKHNVDFTSGADVGNGPIGIVTASTLGLTTASASAIAADEIIDLIHKVDPAYRDEPDEKVGFMFHDSILQIIRKLKDGQGRYLWSNGTTALEPDRLHGYPYWINQSMDSTVSSAKKTMLFGALSKYKVRIVNALRIQRLVERRAEFDEDVFIAYLRADGGLLDAGQHPVKYMTH